MEVPELKAGGSLGVSALFEVVPVARAVFVCRDQHSRGSPSFPKSRSWL